jgi:hypothetical protein
MYSANQWKNVSKEYGLQYCYVCTREGNMLKYEANGAECTKYGISCFFC